MAGVTERWRGVYLYVGKKVYATGPTREQSGLVGHNCIHGTNESAKYVKTMSMVGVQPPTWRITGSSRPTGKRQYTVEHYVWRPLNCGVKYMSVTGSPVFVTSGSLPLHIGVK
jgi:hypothetical protein